MNTSIATMPIIRPISDLRTKLNDVCAEAAKTAAPIFMTKNGSAELVVLSAEAYEEQQQHLCLAAKVQEAEIEARYNTKRYSQAELDEELDIILKHWSK